ncbi:MAG TPA: FAD-binding oxidoreductase [Bryobacteraceae bacterium]|nr:FAD-binding oxidoreductase [Bryobacteraceae bacterium]
MQVSTTDIAPFLEDSSGYRGSADQVLLPATVDEVREIVKQASTHDIPITVAGAGTGLTGARVPQGGWVISLDRFRDIEIQRGRVRCGCGVILADLQSAAAKTRQFFGPNPTESLACVGGIISTNAGGARSFRFGPVGRQVLALEVTFMDGRTVRFKRGEKVDFPYRTVRTTSTTKTAAGYPLRADLDWVDLLSGSEGTLGIITEAELQLLPEPPAMLSGVVFFPSEDLALDAVDVWRRIPRLRLLESMDARALDFLRPKYPDTSPQAKAALMIEQDLDSEEDPEIDLWFGRLAAQSALEEQSWFGLTAADRERFREFRHALPAMTVDQGRRSGGKFSTDFAVPLAKNREMYNYYRLRCEETFPGRYTIFGHVGDANVHVNLLPRDAEEAKRADPLMEDFARKVLSLGGTVAAEHGIGKQKTNLLKLMFSPDEIDAMKAVKDHLDPKWLLGQGTIFELEDPKRYNVSLT